MSASSPSAPRGRPARAFLSLRLLVVAVAALLVLSAPAQARRKHHPPPEFAGLKSATTCIPGPIGPGITSSYHLSWEPATEKGRRSRKIVYEIYQATTPGGEDFGNPTYTTARGVTSFDTPQLSSIETFYFVVRARDRAGNEDSNTVERQGEDLCE